MAARKSISKKLRFEIFKRDCFTCQYCGRMAPDVVLEVDHIKPIKSNGSNDILNLVTSCYDCNRGKGPVEISENQTLKTQQEQLKLLGEKREQLKLLILWREEISLLKDQELDYVVEKIKYALNREINDFGKKDIRRWIREYGLDEVLTAIEIACEKYLIPNNQTAIQNTFNKIGGICYNRRKNKQEVANNAKQNY